MYDRVNGLAAFARSERDFELIISLDKAKKRWLTIVLEVVRVTYIRKCRCAIGMNESLERLNIDGL